MASTFQADLDLALASLASGRAKLVGGLEPLTDADLSRARRGGWAIGRILEHLVESENLYTTAVSAIRKRSVPGLPPSTCTGQPMDEILCRLDSSRRALLTATRGITEEEFYRLEKLGREEYSVLSILENAAHHDEEHALQIVQTLA